MSYPYPSLFGATSSSSHQSHQIPWVAVFVVPTSQYPRLREESSENWICLG